MAVDTRDKRFSMMGLLQPVPSIHPNPDGTIGTQDRAQYEFLYHGIALNSPAVITTTWFDEQQGKILGTKNFIYPGWAGRGRRY